MSKRPDHHDPLTRVAITITMSVATTASSITLRLLHPDETWARCWLEHPWYQAVPMGLLVVTLVAFWWPRGGAR